MILLVSVTVFAYQFTISPGTYEGRSTTSRYNEVYRYVFYNNSAVDIYINGNKDGDTKFYKFEYETDQRGNVTRVLFILMLSDGYSIGHYWINRISNGGIRLVSYHNPSYYLDLNRK